MKGKQPAAATPPGRLAGFNDQEQNWNVIIETPKGCRNKFKYDDRLGVFKLNGVLPAGAAFPYDFGFIPSTLGDDGDPIDVLVLMDEPAFSGCLVGSRLIGVIEAEQTEEDGSTVRNDRLIAVAAHARDYQDLKSVKDMNDNLKNEVEHFFVSYNEMRGKKFKLLGCRGPRRAQRLVEQAMDKFALGDKRSDRRRARTLAAKSS
jgi:inorganic pyrophosphatase